MERKKIAKILIIASIATLNNFCTTTDPFANAKTSEIGSLNTNCLKDGAWDSIKVKYGSTTDTLLQSKIEAFKREIFDNELLFFNDSIKEIIAVDNDHYSVRYVFNPLISDSILNGLSPELSEKEKKRINNKIQLILMEYQCEDGKNESLMRLKSTN